MPKCLFFLNFGTIKVTFNCILLKVISAGQICTTSNDKDKELKRDLRKTPKLSIKLFTLVIISRMFSSLLHFFMILP